MTCYKILVKITKLLEDIIISSLPIINTSISVLAIIIRRIVFISLKIIEIFYNNNNSNTMRSMNNSMFSDEDCEYSNNTLLFDEFLRSVGKCFMNISNAIQLHKHLPLYIISIVSAISHYNDYNTTKSIHNNSNNNASINNSTIITNQQQITINNYLVKEYLLYGIFAMIDKFNINRKKNLEQLYNILDMKSRNVLSDILKSYQNDFKFIGKS
jgi:hypothetical protein